MAGNLNTRQVADVVFCIDASNSMGPCISAVRAHISDFVSGLEAGSQTRWDLRVDFLAYQAGDSANGKGVFYQQSVHHDGMDLVRALYGQGGRRKFFTADISQFCSALSKISVRGDEASFVALDTCLDFPWREAAACHRVVILLTDEPLETGVCKKAQLQKLPDLIEKIQALRVMLFLVGPQSAAFDALCAVDKSEYQVIDQTGSGLAQTDFRKVLAHIGKSVSMSVPYGQQKVQRVARGLFGQAEWSASNERIVGS